MNYKCGDEVLLFLLITCSYECKLHTSSCLPILDECDRKKRNRKGWVKPWLKKQNAKRNILQNFERTSTSRFLNHTDATFV